MYIPCVPVQGMVLVWEKGELLQVHMHTQYEYLLPFLCEITAIFLLRVGIIYQNYLEGRKKAVW